MQEAGNKKTTFSFCICFSGKLFLTTAPADLLSFLAASVLDKNEFSVG